MNLGYIDYLNCYPLYYHMFENEPLPDVRIHPGYPSVLNRMMGTGELDLSPISAASYANLEESVVLLPDFCISSNGYVQSVILASRLPIEELDGKTVGLSRASHTSEVLLKVLMRKYYAIEPVYVPADPNPWLTGQGIDAALIIGNDAMLQKPAEHVYDLGSLWLEKTGHPVVFAVFAVRESAVSNSLKAVEAIVHSYTRSLFCLESERQRLIQKARGKYPLIKSDIDAYYRVLQYSFTDIRKEALVFYLLSAGELGLIRKVGGLKLLDLPQRATEDGMHISLKNNGSLRK